MKPLIYLLLTVAVFFAGSCSTDEVDVFDNHNYISFNFNATDEATVPSTSFTFTFSDASVKEKVFEIPVTYAGRFVDTDMPFTWQVVGDESTAVEGVHYKIDSQTAQTIPANKNNGVAKITLLRTEDMKDKSFELTLQLTDNDYFKAGPVNRVKIIVTDQLVKPDWWNYTVYDRYMGSYSPTKLRLWLEFMKVEDGSNPFETDKYIQWLDYGTGNYIYKNYKSSEVITTIMSFKNWLYEEKGNPYDEDLQKPVAQSLGNY